VNVKIHRLLTALRHTCALFVTLPGSELMLSVTTPIKQTAKLTFSILTLVTKAWCLTIETQRCKQLT